MQENYWNDTYWKNHLEEHKGESLDFLSDLWVDKYLKVINSIPKGKVLDLGCGLGQYTKYFIDKGFEVVSADISAEVLNRLKQTIEKANIIQLDMAKELPFEDNTFNLVFANLAIHYFDENTTQRLMKEVKRILKDGGYFIGSVNSTKTFKFIKDKAIKIEPNYYFESGRNARLWNKKQFNKFFKEYEMKVLEEITTTRWNRTKIMWEFVARVNK